VTHPDVRERLYRRLVPCPDDGCQCLLWVGYVTPKGYGYIAVGRKMRKVHRVAWELDNGRIPDGLTIDHVKAWGCRHRHCANVAHLEPVTMRENLLRGDTIAAAHAAQTHCTNGHLFDDANTYRDRRGWRRCRTCDRRKDSMRRHRTRKPEEAAS